MVRINSICIDHQAIHLILGDAIVYKVSTSKKKKNRMSEIKGLNKNLGKMMNPFNKVCQNDYLTCWESQTRSTEDHFRLPYNFVRRNLTNEKQNIIRVSYSFKNNFK